MIFMCENGNCDVKFERKHQDKRTTKNFCSLKCYWEDKRCDLTGKTFGKWLVIEKIHEPGKNDTFWLCKCECGIEIEVRTKNLLRGRSTQCKFCANSTKYGGLTQRQFGRIKKTANIRNIEFDIDPYDLWNLFESQNRQCYYTGQDITLPVLSHDVFTASLDRVDSSKPYNIDNVVWCHKIINEFKSNLNETKFLLTCDLINRFDQSFYKLSRRINVNNHKEFEGYLEVSKIYLNRFTRQPNCSLTCKDIWDQYERQGGVCYLTGTEIFFEPSISKLKLNPDLQTASINLFNKNLGYHKENIFITHKSISRFQWNFTVEEIKTIAKLVCMNRGLS